MTTRHAIWTTVSRIAVVMTLLLFARLQGRLEAYEDAFGASPVEAKLTAIASAVFVVVLVLYVLGELALLFQYHILPAWQKAHKRQRMAAIGKVHEVSTRPRYWKHRTSPQEVEQ